MESWSRRSGIIVEMKVTLIAEWEDEDLTPEEVRDVIARNDIWEVTEERVVDGVTILTLFTTSPGWGEEAWVPKECVKEVE